MTCTHNGTLSALVNGKYHKNICRSCLDTLRGDNTYSDGYQSHERRRMYEDLAQDTVQPYDAAGKPRSEFYRLYPQAAEKTFTKDEIRQVKRQL